MPAQDLTLQVYQSQAAKADRTRSTKPLSFLLLGLFGEAGTLMDEVKKKQRDARSYVGYERSVVEELGDVLWYLTNIANRERLALSSIARRACQDGVESLSSPGEQLTFSSLQAQQHLPLNAPTPEFERTLMRLVSYVGALANAHNSGDMENAALGAHLSDIFATLVQAANEAGVTLAEAADKNLTKIFDRWPTKKEYPRLFDDGYPPEEQLPRSLVVDVYERVVNSGHPTEKQYVLQRSKGILLINVQK
jgi:NTP pyrophosphatase (non-canonical NTP hydrolase)